MPGSWWLAGGVHMPDHIYLPTVLGILPLQMLYPDTATPPNLPAVVPEQIAAAEQAVLQQADIVRQLKASGQDNSSPAVQQQVQVGQQAAWPHTGCVLM